LRLHERKIYIVIFRQGIKHLEIAEHFWRTKKQQNRKRVLQQNALQQKALQQKVLQQKVICLVSTSNPQKWKKTGKEIVWTSQRKLRNHPRRKIKYL